MSRWDTPIRWEKMDHLAAKVLRNEIRRHEDRGIKMAVHMNAVKKQPKSIEGNGAWQELETRCKK